MRIPRAQGLSNADKKHHTVPRGLSLRPTNAYLGLGASAANRVNPDVLGLDATALVEGHVLHELSTRKASQYESFLSGFQGHCGNPMQQRSTHILRVGDDS